MNNEQKFRQAMGKFATGITVVTTEHDGEPVGMTVNAFMSISLQPKIVAVSIGEQATMYNILPQTKKFGVSFLRDDQKNLSQLFASENEHGQKEMFTFKNDIPILHDCLTHLTCDVVKTTTVGDHMIFFGEVNDIEIFSGDPLLYFGSDYRSIEK